MGERTNYTPGTFCWTDLTTTDQDAAKAFYGGLFGWEFEDFPVGDGAVYSMARLGGKDVAAISPQPQAMREAGAPPTWNSYVAVESADAVADRARELGGNVMSPPFDVMDAGRMAVLQDPEGAFFMLWQPNGHRGAGLVNAPGALCWNELGVRGDLETAAGFYRELLGWETDPFDSGGQPYLVVKNQGRGNGGIRAVMPPEAPAHWAVYFAVEDIDAGIARAQGQGGVNHAGPMDIGIAKIAVIGDPQGATFLLYDGDLED